MKAKINFQCVKVKYCFIIGLILLLFAASSLPSFCQPTSFQIELDSADYRMEDVAVNQSGEIAALLSDDYFTDNSDIYLVPVSGGNTIEHGYKIDHAHGIPFSIESLFFNHNFVFSFAVKGNGTKGRIMSFDMETGEYWTKKLRSNWAFGPTLKIDTEGHLVVANGVPNLAAPYFQDRVLELFKIDETGNIIWKKGMILNKNADSFNQRGVIPYKIAIGADGSLYILGNIASNNNSTPSLPFIIKTDQFGNPLIWKTFPNHFFKDLLFTEDGLYLLDKKSHFPIWEQYTATTILLKLDENLNTIWAKEYAAENCWFFTANINKLSSGRMLLSTATSYSAYPAFFAEIDTNGNILNQKGYPNFNPTVNILNDGAFLISSREQFDSTGQTRIQMTIAKTDSDGNLGGCASYPSCLKVEDITIETGDFTIDSIDAYNLEPDAVDIQPYTFTFSPYCEYPPPPVPDFEFPDTLCIGETAKTTNTYNLLAQAREWHLVGPGVDSTFDSPDFDYHFTTAGDFQLRQTIWLLGCTYTFEKTIVVLPSLEARIIPENICPDSSHELRVISNRLLKNYLWDTGVTTSILSISPPGTYSVEVTDGYCEATDTTYVTDVAQLLGTNPPFTLPLDTVSCQSFELVPQSLFGNMFFMDSDTIPTASFLLEKAGIYQIGMEVFGCQFWKTFPYSVDCHVDIYLPNSFSPNGDGINDVFMPFGPEFEVLELAIYDRWGGLLSKGRDWDGGKSSEGVYLYKLSYINLKSGEKGELNGEITLVK